MTEICRTKQQILRILFQLGPGSLLHNSGDVVAPVTLGVLWGLQIMITTAATSKTAAKPRTPTTTAIMMVSSLGEDDAEGSFGLGEETIIGPTARCCSTFSSMTRLFLFSNGHPLAQRDDSSECKQANTKQWRKISFEFTERKLKAAKTNR